MARRVVPIGMKIIPQRKNNPITISGVSTGCQEASFCCLKAEAVVQSKLASNDELGLGIKK
jgi:hypothetical protein